VRDQEITNPVVPQRHYIDLGHHLPRNLRESEIEKLFQTIADHLRDRTIFTLMLHAGLRVGEIVNLSLGMFIFLKQAHLICDLRAKGIVSESSIYLQPPHNCSANIFPHDQVRAKSTFSLIDEENRSRSQGFSCNWLCTAKKQASGLGAISSDTPLPAG
jgi:hypothetical protein